MKPLFQSKPLHLVTCILLLWKGISVIGWLLLQESGMLRFGEGFFSSTGCMSAVALVFAAAFSDGTALSFFALAVVCIVFLVYWAFFVLLARNRSGAGVASVGLLVLCGLDLPITVAFSFAQWWTFWVCIAFHAAVFITAVLLRRSRPGVPTPLNKLPTSI